MSTSSLPMKTPDLPRADLEMPAGTGARKRRRALAFVALAAVIAIAIGGGVLKNRTTKDSAATPAHVTPALTITTAAARLATWPVTVSASGAIAPWQEASIGARVGGLTLTDIRVNVGDVVKRGQLLARFDADVLRADEAQLRAAIAHAEATAAQTDANRQRALSLKESGGISEQDILQYVTSAATARAAVAAANAQLASKQLQLRYAEVLAPDDGTISARSAALGAVTPAGQELFRLIRQNRLEWRGELTAPQLSQIVAGQRVWLTLPDGGSTVATVRQTAPSLDGQSRLGTVFADLEPRGTARAGMYANGEIATALRIGLVVPAPSVVIRDGRSYVLQVQNAGVTSKVALRLVTVGRRRGAEVEIAEGLAAGAVVAVQGAGFLNDGDVVRVSGSAAAFPLPGPAAPIVAERHPPRASPGSKPT
jgi:RND family efflux transporter MFP subunit